MEFDDSSSAAVRPARRALDGVGERPLAGAGRDWRAASVLIGLYAVALAGF